MNTPTPTPSKDEVNLDNLPLKDALRFVDENSTTGGLFTKAALKTLAAKCRELTAVTEQRDRLAEALNRIANNNVQDLPETDYAYEPGRMEGIAKIALQPLTTNEQVKDIILSYCQGIYHLEFDIEDLDEMVEKIIDNVTDQCG